MASQVWIFVHSRSCRPICLLCFFREFFACLHCFGVPCRRGDRVLSACSSILWSVRLTFLPTAVEQEGSTMTRQGSAGAGALAGYLMGFREELSRCGYGPVWLGAHLALFADLCRRTEREGVGCPNLEATGSRRFWMNGGVAPEGSHLACGRVSTDRLPGPCRRDSRAGIRRPPEGPSRRQCLMRGIASSAWHSRSRCAICRRRITAGTCAARVCRAATVCDGSRSAASAGQTGAPW
jgi:hypothetical protein